MTRTPLPDDVPADAPDAAAAGAPAKVRRPVPVLAIVGRPNVGKSTLFNRLTRSRDALVADIPGLTRDRKYGRAVSAGRRYVLIDTGGLEPVARSGVEAQMARQARQAILEADLVLFVTDTREGLTGRDREIAVELRRSAHRLQVVVNKAEGMNRAIAAADFHALGLGAPAVISAAHGDGVHDLIDECLDELGIRRPGPDEDDDEDGDDGDRQDAGDAAAAGAAAGGRDGLARADRQRDDGGRSDRAVHPGGVQRDGAGDRGDGGAGGQDGADDAAIAADEAEADDTDDADEADTDDTADPPQRPVDADGSLFDAFERGADEPVSGASPPVAPGSAGTATGPTLPAAPRRPIRVAVVGRPNSGKSTLINALLGEERLIAFDAPGTTRDAIEVEFARNGRPYVLIDTAGLRRRGKVSGTVEKFSVVKTLQAIEDCNVCILLIDAADGISEQDGSIASYVLDAGRAVVIGLNKWDIVPRDERERVRTEFRRKLEFLDFARMHPLSAREGRGLGTLMRSVDEAYDSATAKLSTPKLTRLLQAAVLHQPPPRSGPVRPKLRYAHQGGQNPPVIVIHGNSLQNVGAAYRRYLEGWFRRHLGLNGTRMRIELRTGRNPYAAGEGRRRG